MSGGGNDWEERDAKVRTYWRDRGLYDAPRSLEAPTFTSIIPAPNATGDLHLGHALNLVVQDVLCRWRALKGDHVVWSGAISHGGFNTQMVVERNLRAHERAATASDLRREELAREVQDWIAALTPRLFAQMQQIGAVLDCAEQRRTDDVFSDRLAASFFVEFHAKGLIYPATSVVEWCPGCCSTIERIDQVLTSAEETWYQLRYQSVERPRRELRILTRDLETLDTDVALGVLRDDPQWAGLAGKRFVAPNGAEVLVLECSELPESGDAPFRVTPAHDRWGHRVARSRGLSCVRAFDEHGTMLSGPFQGLPRSRARAELAKEWRARGLLKEVNVVRERRACKNCGSAVEELESRQWFLSIGSLLEPALELFRSGVLKVRPERYERQIKVWLTQQLNARKAMPGEDPTEDWCVSRQLACGNPFPVWTCACGASEVAVDAVSCPRCGTGMKREASVMPLSLSDTLWPFCANRAYTQDRRVLDRLGRNGVCVTGADLLFYWIAPIAMLASQLDDPLPFSTALIHPLICDENGNKMSKSLGNVIEPGPLIQRYGSDALRLTLLQALDLDSPRLPFPSSSLEDNAWLLQEFARRCREILGRNEDDEALGQEHAFGRLREQQAAIDAALADYRFADVYVEASKLMQNLIESSTRSRLLVKTYLEVLHPILPFTTEAVHCEGWPDEPLLACGRAASAPEHAVPSVNRQRQSVVAGE
jgi:valyl-tRNA synthetase